MDFIEATANLKAEIYGLPQVKDRKAVKSMVAKVTVPEFTPKSGVRIDVNDADMDANRSSGNCGNDLL